MALNLEYVGVISKEEYQTMLTFLQDHRQQHPLPREWNEDLGELVQATQGDNVCPTIRYWKFGDDLKGEISLEVCLNGNHEFDLTDTTGELVGQCAEDLIFTLVGSRPRYEPIDEECYHEMSEEEAGRQGYASDEPCGKYQYSYMLAALSEKTYV